MSGIVGIHNLDQQPVEANNLRRMVDMISHRGPDGSGVWTDGAVGLGHRLLWTTPESIMESLPLVTRNLAITADARIDNRDELIPLLALDNICPTEKISDSNIILAAYEKWGKSCPSRLLGAFAFAIWDERRQTLFCARDHFGVKPFYYYASERFFVFATEIKALFCISEVPQNINEVRIGDYLTSNYEDTEITFYREIFRLKPAHHLTVSRHGVNTESYWTLNVSRELRLGSDDEYAEAFLDIFKEATARCMRSSSPIGSMLSGGMDSSSIACLAGQLLGKAGPAIPTLSAIFDEIKESDEQPYIQAVLDHGNFTPNYIHGDQFSPLIDYEKIQWHQDEPHGAFNLFINWNLYKVAKSQNIRVVLDGFDGDSTISHGVSYMNDLAESGQWLTLYREIHSHSKKIGYSSYSAFFSLLKQYSPFMRLAQRAYRATIRKVSGEDCHNSDQYEPYLNQNFVQRTQMKERHKNLAQQWRTLSGYPFYKRDHYYCLVRGVMPHTLETLNHASSAFSVEVRFPFCDRHLVEFCLSLPPEQRIKQGWTRIILRRGMANILPKKVQWRNGKSNLGVNFNHTFLKYEDERIKDLLNRHKDIISSYANIESLEEAYDRYTSGVARNDDIINLWKSVTLVLWLQRDKVYQHSY